ncbi:hypothetical protein BDD12DRAFT_722955, partial [Trichophaea hybrida]
QHTAPTLTEPIYPARQQYPTQLPDVVGFDPRQGTEGTIFTVYLHSLGDLIASPRSYRLVFGSHRCVPSIAKHSSHPDEYQLSIEVPSFRSTGWRSPQVKVSLVMEDEGGQQLGAEELVGMFTYTDAPAFASPPRATLKRKASADSADLRSPAKRAATQPLRPKSEDYGYGGFPTPASAQYTSYGTSASTDRTYGVYSSYDHESGHQGSYHPPQASPRNFSYSYAGAPEIPHASAGPSAQTWPTPQFTPSATAADNTGLLPSPSEVPNPTLIRTSTLQAVDKGGDGVANRGPGFNPYSIPHKAVLEIQGDLSTMARRWTEEEWSSKRRLVQFWRQQKGSMIHATFRPIPQSDRPTSAVCVSCIWWAERNECFVTSVDCIYLLESLIGVRFTVEEKNRIRRNLEGFRPLTVSKGKKECESFFKLIMQFPSPKPRNIEKDVKVFAWSILPHALKKIIGKYSASYSSTASIIPPTPGASPYPGAPLHESSHPRPENMPPRGLSEPSVAEPIAPTASVANAHATTRPATAPLAENTTSPAIGSPGNRASAISDSHISSLPGVQVAGWAQSQTLPATPHPIAPAPAHRGGPSWDVSPFIEPAPSSRTYYQPEHAVSTEERISISGGTHPSPQSTSNVNVP